MRKLVACMLLTVIGAAPVGVAALPPPAASPRISYWIDYYVIPDKATQMAGVYAWTDYHLESGEYIGTDAQYWDGTTASAGSSLMNYVAAGIAGGLGGNIGENIGAWAGAWVASQVAIEASYATYWLGLAAMVAGPWVGFVVGVTVGAA